MLNQNRIGKYMLYAIGEVVLISIGLIIALQINNWSERKKARSYEIKMLTEVRNALENDIAYFNRMVNRMAILDTAVNEFIALAYHQSTFEDSLYNVPTNRGRWYMLRTGVAYRYNSGPYQAIKSSGMDKISNDSLRNKLVNLYDFDLPRHMEVTKWYDRGYEENMSQLTAFLEDAYIEEVDGEYEIHRKFPPDLLQKQEFVELLSSLRFRARNVGRHIDYMIPHLEELVVQINREIEK